VRLIRITASLVVLTSVAYADHHGMVMESDESPASTYTAGVSLLAATFSPSLPENMYFGGNYQGVVPSASWAMGRYAAGASWAYYRMRRNGNEDYGVGDLVAHGQVAIVTEHDVQAGAMFAVSAPTGSDAAGFGMGHPMVMPAAYAGWRSGPVAFAGSFGYSRALVSGVHVHGMAPLVEPMNMSELTWSGSGDVAVGRGVRAGARVSGGIPVGSLPGTDRVVGALRIAWGEGRVDTAFEFQAGLAGDPFNIRGVVSTALRF
jgi:hypothetical protein